MKSRLPGCEFGVALPLGAGGAGDLAKTQGRSSRNSQPSVPFPLAARFVAATCLLACVCVASAAQGQSAPPQNPSAAEQLPPGTTICAVLEKTLDARKAKTGDAVIAKTTMAVVSQGKVVVASGGQVLGHVTQATARSKNANSELGIAFDWVVLKGGDKIPLPTVVQAIGYGGFRPGEKEDTIANPTYSAAAGAAAVTAANSDRRSNSQTPRIETSGTPTPEAPETAGRNPALDAGSKGVVGIKGLTLTEGTDAGRGSVITAEKKDVKLERGSQFVLRVVTAAHSF